MNSEPFQLTLPIYSGPFDLLLAAIKDDRINLFEVSISQITASYFEYMRNLETIDLNASSEFLLMASILLEMKSRRVLPQPEEINLLMEEEEIQNDLVMHLEQYKIFKVLAQGLKEKKEAFKRIYSRYHREVLGPEGKKDFYLKDVNLHDLVLAFKNLWDQAEKEQHVHRMQDDDITLPERIEEVKKILAQFPDGVEFEKLFIRRTRVEIVVTFLAMLELARSGTIRIRQGGNFSGIRVFRA